MKKSTKLISVILSLALILSMVPMAFAGTLKTETYNTVEKLIQNDSLANILESLVTDINSAKGNVTGTVLRLVYMFMNNDEINALIGDRDVAEMSDNDVAKVLLDWLDKNLPVWTADITNQDWYGPVSNLVKVIGITLDLKSVDGILKTAYSLCDKADDKLFGRPIINLGILNDLNGSALNGLSRSKGDLNVIYGLLQWLKDNMPVVKKALNGNLNVGIVGNFFDTGDIENMIKNVPLFAKSAIYKLVKSDAAIGKFSKDANEAKGEWGTSPYAGYTADELLASALIRLIKNNDEVVPQAEAQKATTLSVYGILSEYAGDLYNNFAIDWINENLANFINNISVTPEIKAKFKATIPQVDNSTIADILKNAKTTGFLGQLNALLVKVAELVLTPAEFTKLGLTTTNNNNTDLNENVEKICRYILPLMANKTVSDNLGYDFTAFTADAIKDKSTEEMAVAILKLFFDGWFKSNPGYDKSVVASATSLEDLAVLAVYYTATNTEWLNLDFDFSGFASQIFNGKTVKSFGNNGDAAKDLIISMGVGIGAGALQHNVKYTKYTSSFTSKTIGKGDVNGDGSVTSEDARYALRAAVGYDDSAEGIYLDAADVDGEGISSSDARIILRNAVGLEEIEGTVSIGAGWKDYVDDITDWALNFIKGLPAVVPATAGLTTVRGEYDPYNDKPFDKLNLVLNQLIDFRFLSNTGNDTYALDFDTLVNDVLLGNLLDFDLEGLLATFEVNSNAGNVLNAPYTVVSAALSIVDRAISCLFKVQ